MSQNVSGVREWWVGELGPLRHCYGSTIPVSTLEDDRTDSVIYLVGPATRPPTRIRLSA